MKQSLRDTHLYRRTRFLVLLGGVVVFVFFGATIVLSSIASLREQRQRILDYEVPRLMRGTREQVLTFFRPLGSTVELLVALGDWEEILAQAAVDPAGFRRQAEEWAAIVGVTDIAVLDILREVVYAYWSDEPIILDPALERDQWFYETWAIPNPPDRKLTFYYDENVGGRAFFYDYLLRDSEGSPAGTLGVLVELEGLAQLLQRELSAGEYVYLVDHNDRIILEISQDTLREFLPVYTVTGIEAQDAVSPSLDNLLIPGRYIEAARTLRQPAITSDGSYAVGVFSLPEMDLTARIFLSTRERLEYVRATLLRQMVALLITFSLVIGGYMALIAVYANRNTKHLLVIQRNRAQLDEIVSVLAHNLGNDLQILRGQVMSQREAVQRELDPLLLDMEQVLQNAILSVQLADDTSPVLRHPVDGDGLRERLEHSCTIALRAKEQTLLSSFTPREPREEPVLTDEDLVFHVLLNLLSNAIKYSPAGSAVLVAGRSTPAGMEFIVADQGPGFTREDRTRLFRKYSRLSARPTRGERSTGVGLFVSARLAERLGAELALLDTVPSWAPDFPGNVGAVWLLRVPGSRSSHDTSPLPERHGHQLRRSIGPWTPRRAAGAPEHNGTSREAAARESAAREVIPRESATPERDTATAGSA